MHVLPPCLVLVLYYSSILVVISAFNPLALLSFKAHYHGDLCLVTTFLPSLRSRLPSPINLSDALPSHSLAFSPFPPSSFLSLIEMQAQGMREEGYLMCVFVLAPWVSSPSALCPDQAFSNPLLLMVSQEDEVTGGG